VIRFGFIAVWRESVLHSFIHWSLIIYCYVQLYLSVWGGGYTCRS